MKLKLFQKQDLARAALHNGLILSWDTGLGKTWALFLWMLMKVGYTVEPIGLGCYLTPKGGRKFAANAKRIRPKSPVLIIAPGDLHQQIIDEGWERFGVVVMAVDSQATFERLTRGVGRLARVDHEGRPVLEPDFYITSYTQLTTNGVERIPDVQDHLQDLPRLRQQLCLSNGEHVGLDAVDAHCQAAGIRWPVWKEHRPHFNTTCEFFAWREVCWRDIYLTFDTTAKSATREGVESTYQAKMEELNGWRDQKAAEAERALVQAKYDVIRRLVSDQPDPKLKDLEPAQQDFVLKYFLYYWLADASENDGVGRSYTKMSDGTWLNTEALAAVKKTGTVDPNAPTEVATWRIKCVYSPSLSDLCYNAFKGVAIDEGVKMKGADTYVGLGVRQMDPDYRLVLTATPIKNRVPDLFWLAHWATGGKTEAHARFPFSSDPGDQNLFAETFMVSESNVTKEEKSKNEGKSKRFKKLTAEVCNVHRLWKLLGPILIRRRKDDCGEDIVPKVRRVVRCKMGTLQSKVYQYHLQAIYLDVNGDDALGARLQSLRQAAADPTCELPLKHARAEDCPTEDCRCTRKPVPAAEQLRRLHERRQSEVESFRSLSSHLAGKLQDPKAVRAHENSLAEIDHELANPIQRFDSIPPDPKCQTCGGDGKLPLPHRSGNNFIPKHASVLNLIREILDRNEQVVIGAAFNAPLDVLSGYLTQANVRHLKLDGRTSQKKRGQLAAHFKQGRVNAESVPVMLAGVECMAEGHSFHLANNVILLAYSWAYDKFIQFINRVHRMTSPWPVNVYVVLCEGTIDRRLESLVGEKGDSAELVLDGHLIGERSEEINLSELINVAYREFDADSDTIDEGMIHAQWPNLRTQLAEAMAKWQKALPAALPEVKPSPLRIRTLKPASVASQPPSAKPVTSRLRYNPASGKYTLVGGEAVPLPPPTPTPAPTPATDWRTALRGRAPKPMLASSKSPWDDL